MRKAEGGSAVEPLDRMNGMDRMCREMRVDPIPFILFILSGLPEGACGFIVPKPESTLVGTSAQSFGLCRQVLDCGDAVRTESPLWGAAASCGSGTSWPEPKR